MLAACSASQVAYCSIGVDGRVLVNSRTSLTQPTLCDAAAWDTISTCLLLPTQTCLLSLDPASKKPPNSLKTWKSAPIQTLAISGPKNALYYCQNKKLVSVEPKGQPRALIQGDFCSNVSEIQVSKDQSFIACLSSFFYYVDVTTKSQTVLEGVHNQGVGSFCFSYHQNDRLYATDQGDVLIYDLKISSFPSKRVAAGDASMVAMKASPIHQNRIALADCKHRIYLLDTMLETPMLKKFTLSHPVTTLSWNASGDILLIGNSKGEIISFSIDDLDKEPSPFAVVDPPQAISCIINIPLKIKFKPGSPKPTPAFRMQIKRPPLADGTNVARSVSSPNIKTKSTGLKSPKLSSSIRPRVSEPHRRASKKGLVLSATKNIIPKISDPNTSEKPPPLSHCLTPDSSSRPPSVAPSNQPSVDERSNRTTIKPPTSTVSPSPSLSPGLSRRSESDEPPSTPSTPPDSLIVPHSDTPSLVSPPLPYLTLDTTMKIFTKGAQAQLPGMNHATPLAGKVRSKPSVTFKTPEVARVRERKVSGGNRISSKSEGMPFMQTTHTSRELRTLEVAQENELKDLVNTLREESRDSILNLHLDLVRMNRTWQAQVQSTLQECLTEWRDLKQENAKLKTENAWLRSL